MYEAGNASGVCGVVRLPWTHVPVGGRHVEMRMSVKEVSAGEDGDNDSCLTQEELR